MFVSVQLWAPLAIQVRRTSFSSCVSSGQPSGIAPDSITARSSESVFPGIIVRDETSRSRSRTKMFFRATPLAPWQEKHRLLRMSRACALSLRSIPCVAPTRAINKATIISARQETSKRRRLSRDMRHPQKNNCVEFVASVATVIPIR